MVIGQHDFFGFNQETRDAFHLERDKYEDYELFLDVLIEFVIVGEENDWILIKDVFLNLTSDAEDEGENNNSSASESLNVEYKAINDSGKVMMSENLERAQEVRHIIIFISTIIFIAISAAIVVTSRVGRENEEENDSNDRSKTRLGRWYDQHKHQLRALIYPTIMTLIFLYWRFSALNDANPEAVRQVKPEDYQNYTNYVVYSTFVLALAWPISNLTTLAPNKFPANSIQTGVKSVVVSSLWMSASVMWSTTLITTYNIENITVVRDLTPSAWPFLLLTIFNLVMNSINLVMAIRYKKHFEGLRYRHKVAEYKFKKETQESDVVLNKKIFRAIDAINYPQATLDNLLKAFEQDGFPTACKTGEVLSELYLESLVSEGLLEVESYVKKTIYVLSEDAFELLEKAEEKEKKEEREGEKELNRRAIKN